MSKIKLLFFLIIITLLFNQTFASMPADSIKSFCLNPLDLKDSKIKNLEISIFKNNKWQKNLIKAYLSDHDFISDEYKKKFKAKILVLYSNEKKCTYNSRIRLSGDMRDHIRKSDKGFFSSLDIEIDDNIFGIVKFKLLLPKTRNYENEVFSNFFLRNLDFLSPRSFIVTAIVNGIKNKYTFVESNLRKEFLESQKRIEGPIISVDDSNLFSKKDKLKKISIAKLRNVNWIKDDLDKLELSIEAITKLNYYFFTQSLRNKHYIGPINGNFDDFENEFFLKDSKDLKLYYEYLVIVTAIGATHNFSVGDSRFYYNPYKKNFEMIFNDGESNILFLPDRLNYKLLNNIPIETFDNLINKILKLDRQILYKKLKNLGLTLNQKKLNKILNLVMDRIKSLRDNNKIVKNSHRLVNYYKYEFFLDNIISSGNLFSYYDQGRFYLCDNKTDCSNSIFDNDEIKKLLNQKLKYKNKKVFFIGSKKIQNIDKIKNKNYWKKFSLDEIVIYYISKNSIKYNKSLKEIYLNIIDLNSRFLIQDLTINDWKIYLNSDNKILSKKYQKLQSGCLSFYNVNFENVSLYAKNTYCEDSINIIKSSGNISEILISNSNSDSIDFDFSDISIQKINITNSINDCIDFSFGNYIVNNIITKNCKDKSISAGENTKLTINNFIDEQSNISIAVKDSSDVSINELTSVGSEVCFSLFRKKQEFANSILKINNLNHDCLVMNNYVQDKSLLMLNNEK